MMLHLIEAINAMIILRLIYQLMLHITKNLHLMVILSLKNQMMLHLISSNQCADSSEIVVTTDVTLCIPIQNNINKVTNHEDISSHNLYDFNSNDDSSVESNRNKLDLMSFYFPSPNLKKKRCEIWLAKKIQTMVAFYLKGTKVLK